jgi:Fic family protein
MQSRITGTIRRTRFGGEEVAAFVPLPLPPKDPPLALAEPMRRLLTEAEVNLATLQAAAAMIPSLDWFIYAFVRKEAVISSQVEGTQATLVDLFNYEADARLSKADALDVKDICNHLEALNYARKQLGSQTGLPISIRLLNEAHRRLLKGVRGEQKQPGEVRTSQNWIGGSRPGNAAFVPPPPDELAACLSALERYMHSEDESLPKLIRIALIHAQFETIHPYLDGNGRIGRLLITLLLREYQLLHEPLLYLSLHFKRHRRAYYESLTAVRQAGDWEGWVRFFLEGVRDVARETADTAQHLFRLISQDRARLMQAKEATMATLRLFEQLPTHPIMTLDSATDLLGSSKPTANAALNVLVREGILRELTGKQRDRAFGYDTYLKVLGAGTEL